MLAVYPCSRGFRFAVFESMNASVDWNIRKTTKKTVHSVSLANVERIIDWYHPQFIVMPDYTCTLLHGSAYAKKLVESIVNKATSENIAIRQYQRKHIRECFTAQFGAKNKHEIANAIANVLPELELRLPPPRPIWKNESYNMPLFDAVSLLFTFYYFEYLRSE